MPIASLHSLDESETTQGLSPPRTCRESAQRFGAPAVASRLVELYRTALDRDSSAE